MVEKIKKFFNEQQWFLMTLLLIAFIFIRFPGLDLLYHQDEYKWPQYVNPALFLSGAVPHPPLTEFIYSHLGRFVGYDNFRLIPFSFGILNFLLIFYLSKTIFDKDRKTALWIVFLFAISFYSILATLMVDVDGAVMPMFFLIMMIGYYRLRKTNFQFSIFNFQNLASAILLIVGAVGGFFIKVSFLLPLCAIFLDYILEKTENVKNQDILRYIVRYGSYLFLFLIGFFVLLLASKAIFPFFNLSKALTYWEHFAVFSGRGWFQTFIQFGKSVMYTSPLLFIPVFFSDREIWAKLRPFFFLVFLGLFFYLFAFDFSIGALDRYFQFLVVPLCLISGAVFSKFFKNVDRRFVVSSIALSSLLFLSQFVNQAVPALYPKTEWFFRLISFHWNFLFPFTGGSGPTGFYVSFLFIGMVWLFSIFSLCLGKSKKLELSKALFVVLVIGLFYNGVFIEEYLFGKINGSPYELFSKAKEFIEKDKDIKKVMVYNDIGGFEIQKTGKYERRIYAAPQFESTYREIFSKYNGHILYIDIPRVDPNGLYANYFSRCKDIYNGRDKYVTTQILECNPLK